jgi:hypothetical protein
VGLVAATLMENVVHKAKPQFFVQFFPLSLGFFSLRFCNGFHNRRSLHLFGFSGFFS